MRIACPDCGAAYDVPDTMLSAGREVRCARCGRGWAPLAAAPIFPEPPPLPVSQAPAPPVPPPAIEPVPWPEPLAAAEPAVAVPSEVPLLPPHDERRLALAWSFSVMSLLLGVVGVVIFHAEISSAWPPAFRLFRAIGLS